MKYVVWFLLILAVALIIAGICNQYIINGEKEWNTRLYGSGIIILFFVWMPTFLFWRMTKTRFFEEINKQHLKD